MRKPDHPWLSTANFWPASLYLLLLGVLGAVLFELNQERHWIPLEWLAAGLAACTFVGGYRLIHRLRRAMSLRTEVITLTEDEAVRGAAGLIAFVSQEKGRTSALQAAEYHVGRGSLRHLWLITTRAAESDGAWVAENVKALSRDVTVHELQFLDDKDNIREAKTLVEHLRNRAMKDLRVREEDVICDFTGLTKNASAGMILACAPKDARLQYMVPNRLMSDGRADTLAGSRPREMFIQYTVLDEEEE
jgi:hypothetical protein